MPAETTPSPMEIWHALNSLNKKLISHADRAFSKIHLRFIEFRVLFTLSKIGPSPMVRIARELGVTKAAVTSITDEIETRGLVSRDRDTKDRRILNLEITPAGRRLLARAEETHFEIVTRLISDLTPEEKRVLIRSYEKLNKSLDALV